jgi:alcohol dehydrogenase class IV
MPAGAATWPDTCAVEFGDGALTRLTQAVSRSGAKRVLVVTGATLSRSRLLQQLRSLLGTDSTVYAGVKQHAPYDCMAAGARVAKECGADMLISLGGGSATDVAKGIRLAIAQAQAGEYEAFFERCSERAAVSAQFSFDKPMLPHIAVPTTLSGSEFSGAIGATDIRTGRKFAIVDRILLPQLVILDPRATLETPAPLWVSGALKVLSDAFEEICSPRSLPFVDALALHAIRLIDTHLLDAALTPANLHSRAMLQHATWMSQSVKGHTGLGIVCALRHQIGALFGVPHGTASCIAFAAGLGFNRPLVDERLAIIAPALGISASDVSSAADAVLRRGQELIRAAGMPTSLHQVGVSEARLGELADAVMHDRQLRNNPRQVHSVQEIHQLLQTLI